MAEPHEELGRQKAIIEQNRNNRIRNADKLEKWAVKNNIRDIEIMKIVNNLKETLY